MQTSGLKSAPIRKQNQDYMAPKSYNDASKDGKKVNELSAGEEGSTSESDTDFGAQIVTANDWKPPRSLIEHVFVTDVTANLVTVTVKESPTSVGFSASGTTDELDC
ncbi:hypothetical protein WMY93_002099 [Mugilogobius chulae]|uniref:Uncharacterized protein n=1 Tax=Mugilogobius chulae TaxID=88201 RepID=A0AAW0PU76_9GOBI